MLHTDSTVRGASQEKLKAEVDAYILKERRGRNRRPAPAPQASTSPTPTTPPKKPIWVWMVRSDDILSGATEIPAILRQYEDIGKMHPPEDKGLLVVGVASAPSEFLPILLKAAEDNSSYVVDAIARSKFLGLKA